MSAASEDMITREPMERSFAQVPDDLITDDRLSHLAVRLWCRLDKYAGRNGNAFPLRKTLAADLGVSPAGIGRALMELTKAGWLVRQPRPNGASWISILNNRPSAPKPNPVSDTSRPRIARDTGSDHGRYAEGHPLKDTHLSDNLQDEEIVKSAAPTTSPVPPKQRTAPPKPQEEEEPPSESEMGKVIRDALPAGLSAGINRTTMNRLVAGLVRRGWSQAAIHLAIREHDWDYANGSGAAVSWLKECERPNAKRGCPDCKGTGFTNYGGYDKITVCDCAEETLLSVPGVDYQDA